MSAIFHLATLSRTVTFLSATEVFSNEGITTPIGVLPWVALAIELLVRCALVLFILGRKNRNSTTSLAWVVLIITLPIVGALSYLLVGEARLGKRRLARHRRIVTQTRNEGWTHGAKGLYPIIKKTLEPQASLVESVGGFALRGGNAVELIGDTDKCIASMVADIDQSVDHCHMLFYIMLGDSSGTAIAEALIRAAQRGVECRLLLDAVGSKALLAAPLVTDMRDAGVSVVSALPANLVRAALSRLDLRNHRKVAVIDGQLAYTGSQNIADAAFAPKPKFAPWVDAMLRIRGPAVRDLQELFIEDWYLDSDESLVHKMDIDPPMIEDGVVMQIVPTGPGDHHEGLRLISQSAFHLAREEIQLTTPYFVPAEPEVDALCVAARRGVRTRLVVPARNDSPLVAAASRSRYEQLLEAGVEIYEYTKGLLHAKTMTIDRELAMVGTANFDRRSFELNFEVSALLYDKDFAGQLRFLQRSYMSDSIQVDRNTWLKRGYMRRLSENALGMFSPLL
ncbi:MAG: cardiolipin synthase [Pseudohongiellaceae bacterium]